MSVIIPAYNSREFLDICVPSLLHEEVLDELDIIIVNDGSRDDTAAVAEKYCRMHPDSVRLISQENKGHGGALNTGCAAAVGKYLKAIDADDWVLTENLPIFIAKLRECSADVVLTHYRMHDITTGEITNWKSYPDAFDKPCSFGEIMQSRENFARVLTFHGITYRRDFYQREGIRLSEGVFYEDYEYSAIPCCYARSIMPLDLFLYEYRVGDVQQSVSDENQLRRVGHTETVLDRLIREYGALGLPEQDPGREYCCMKVRELFLNYCITTLLVQKDKKKGRRMADAMLQRLRLEMPRVYQMVANRYRVFLGMNLLNMNKGNWEIIKNSWIYHRIMGKRSHL